MTLQQICVSLELAKQLENEGYTQDSLFTWKVGIESGHPNLVITNEKGFDRTNRFFYFYAAPTAAEIGEQLPLHYSMTKSKSVKDPHWFSQCWWGDTPNVLRNPDKVTEWYQKHNKSMVNGMAEAWLHLKAINLIKEAV